MNMDMKLITKKEICKDRIHSILQNNEAKRIRPEDVNLAQKPPSNLDWAAVAAAGNSNVLELKVYGVSPNGGNKISMTKEDWSGTLEAKWTRLEDRQTSLWQEGRRAGKTGADLPIKPRFHSVKVINLNTITCSYYKIYKMKFTTQLSIKLILLNKILTKNIYKYLVTKFTKTQLIQMCRKLNKSIRILSFLKNINKYTITINTYRDSYTHIKTNLFSILQYHQGDQCLVISPFDDQSRDWAIRAIKNPVFSLPLPGNNLRLYKAFQAHELAATITVVARFPSLHWRWDGGGLDGDEMFFTNTWKEMLKHNYWPNHCVTLEKVIYIFLYNLVIKLVDKQTKSPIGNPFECILGGKDKRQPRTLQLGGCFYESHSGGYKHHQSRQLRHLLQELPGQQTPHPTTHNQHQRSQLCRAPGLFRCPDRQYARRLDSEPTSMFLAINFKNKVNKNTKLCCQIDKINSCTQGKIKTLKKSVKFYKIKTFLIKISFKTKIHLLQTLVVHLYASLAEIYYWYRGTTLTAESRNLVCCFSRIHRRRSAKADLLLRLKPSRILKCIKTRSLENKEGQMQNKYKRYMCFQTRVTRQKPLDDSERHSNLACQSHPQGRNILKLKISRNNTIYGTYKDIVSGRPTHKLQLSIQTHICTYNYNSGKTSETDVYGHITRLYLDLTSNAGFYLNGKFLFLGYAWVPFNQLGHQGFEVLFEPP